jgi:hypothetical protein
MRSLSPYSSQYLNALAGAVKGVQRVIVQIHLYVPFPPARPSDHCTRSIVSNQVYLRMCVRPSSVQHVVDQIPGALRRLFDYDLNLNQLHLRHFSSNVSQELQFFCNVVETQ